MSGATLLPEIHTERLELTEIAMTEGIPFVSMDALAPKLKYTVNSSNMGAYVPIIQRSMLDKLTCKLHGESFSLIFDGTTRLGEATAVIARFCNAEFEIHHVLVRLVTTELPVNGADLAAVIDDAICERLRDAGGNGRGLSKRQCVGFVSDSCSVNIAATTRLTQYWPMADHLLCLAHTLDNAGSKAELTTVKAFVDDWLQLFGHSHAARVILKRLHGTAVVSFSSVRWHSREEVQKFIFSIFDDLPELFDAVRDQCADSAALARLQETINDPDKSYELKLGLAAVEDVLTKVIQATYAMEGNRAEILLAHAFLCNLEQLGDALEEDATNSTLLPQVSAE